MASTYSSSGIVLDRYADILEDLIADAETIWGEEVDTEEDSLLGHLLRLVALLQAEINDIVQDVYDSGSVSSATGTRLDGLLELLNIDRQSAAYSTVTLTLTADRACTVPAGTQYSTGDGGITFATDEAVVFTALGTDDVDATCTVTGEYNAAAGTVTTIVNSVYGITGVTNAAAATPGRDRETDPELRARHTIAVSTSGDSDAASIYEAVSAVTGVSSCYVYDNDTDSTVGGIPAHHIHVSCIGGAAADIAEAINNTKTSTVPMYGSSSVSYYDDTTSQLKTIKYSAAGEVDLYMTIEATKQTGIYPDDGDDQVKAALVAHLEDFEISDDVIYTELYRPIYSVAGLVVTKMWVGTAADLPLDAGNVVDVTMSDVQKATLTTANISLTVT